MELIGGDPPNWGAPPPRPPGGSQGAPGLRDNRGLTHAIVSEYDRNYNINIWGQNMMSKYEVRIRYQKMISKYDDKKWYPIMISNYDIIVWYHIMISYYDIILWYHVMIS